LVLLLLIALSRLDAEELLHSLRQVPPGAVLLLLALQIVSQLLINLQWHCIAKFAAVKVSFWEMLYINCQGAVMDAITPGVKIGGEVTRAVQISRIGNCPGEQAAAVVALQKLFSLSAFFLLALFALGWLAGSVLILPAVAALVLGLLSRVQRARRFLQTFKEQARHIWKDKMACALLFLLSLLIWLLYPVKLYLLAAQFSPDANILSLVGPAFAAYLVAMIPIFPGGLGGFEGTMTALLFAVGFLLTDAAVITVLFRFVTFWFVLLLSLVVIAVYRKRRSANEV